MKKIKRIDWNKVFDLEYLPESEKNGLLVVVCLWMLAAAWVL